MLFNSFSFVLLFLPTVLMVFFTLNKYKLCQLSIYWLILASLFFYGFWNPKYLILISISILVNYSLGNTLTENLPKIWKKIFLFIGITFNLGLIIYFKYTDFFITTTNSLIGTSYNLQHIILPLAISFFTFQQISYLVDVYHSPNYRINFSLYALFVLFFPQLIAGPIVQHQDIIPQFKKVKFFLFSHKNLSIGLAIFFLGLFKKVVIADQCALYATPIFDLSEIDGQLTFAEGWFAAISYSFQLYFDFSGYSDMAIGIGKMFNLNLPINFNSPYKSNNIIDFWKRWHITLSSFLKLYLYIPLGGNRKGEFRKYVNILITMLLGGLWHGASLSYLIWGGLHGMMIVINHIWHYFINTICKKSKKSTSILSMLSSRGLTFLSITSAWVIFRAETLEGAKNIYKAMFGFNGISLTKNLEFYINPITSNLGIHTINYDGLFQNVSYNYKQGFTFMVAVSFLAFLSPNILQIFNKQIIGLNAYTQNTKDKKLIAFSPNHFTLVTISLVAILSMLHISRASEFLYFQF